MDEEINIDDLDPFQLSLLMLTNEGTGPDPLDYNGANSFLLTTKEAYFWGVLIATLAKQNPTISESDFINAYKDIVVKYKDQIKADYANIFPFSPLGSFDYQYANFRLVMDDLGARFNVKFYTKDLWEDLKKAFGELVKADLIKDPIFTAIFGLPVAVAGFIPIGFTQRTKKGGIRYRKIRAFFWTYERKEKDGEVSTHLNFRIWKIVNIFRKKMAEVVQEVIEQGQKDEEGILEEDDMNQKFNEDNADRSDETDDEFV